MSVASWLLALPALLPAQAGADRTEDGARPNVLFVLVDDLNDWVGPLGGHPQARTPALDRLAERAVVFTNAHCAATVCHPSRTALLTGIPPHRSGLYGNDVPFRTVLPDVETLPQAFRRAGYVALGGGKILHRPDPASWDERFPARRKPRADDPLPSARVVPLGGLAANFDWGPLDVADAEMGDARLAAWAAGVLGREHERPFFLAVGLYRPHLPWFVPARHFDALPADAVELPPRRADDLADVPAAGRRLALKGGEDARIEEAGLRADAVRAYLASVAFADARIAELLDALADGPNAANTVVVVTSDHGYHLGEKEHWRKSTPWEEATRVPLLVALPPGAETAAGARCARPVSLLDVYPTLLELCTLEPREDLSGTSLLPLLVDPEAPRAAPVLTTVAEGVHSLRSERWRYVRYADGTEELYDHASDPHEWTNLAGDPALAEVRAELARALPKRSARDARTRFRQR
jgi:arylsulfatase A-like enzyme